MPLQDGKSRPWREVAEDLTQETDAAKILELSDELNEALAGQRGDVESQGSDSKGT